MTDTANFIISQFLINNFSCSTLLSSGEIKRQRYKTAFRKHNNNRNCGETRLRHKKAMTNFSDISFCQISRRLSFRPRVFLIHFASWRRYSTQIYYINLPWQRQRTGIDTRSFVIQPRRKGKKNGPKFPCS